MNRVCYYFTTLCINSEKIKAVGDLDLRLLDKKQIQNVFLDIETGENIIYSCALIRLNVDTITITLLRFNVVFVHTLELKITILIEQHKPYLLKLFTKKVFH